MSCWGHFCHLSSIFLFDVALWEVNIILFGSFEANNGAWSEFILSVFN